MFNRTRENIEGYADLLERKEDQWIGKINERGDDMSRETRLWLCWAFALMALAVGITYIVLFFNQIGG